MSVEDKALVRRLVEEAQSGGDLEVVDELLAEDFVDHSAFPGVPPDRDGARQLFGALHAAFEDFHAVIHQQVAEGGKVATRKTFHGVHRGEFMGVPPTAKRVSFDVIDVLYVRGGRITDHWTQVDLLGLMQQLGVIPPPPERIEPAPDDGPGSNRGEDRPEENEATLRRAIESWNEGDLAGYLEMYSPEVVLHGYQGVEPGLESARRFYEGFWTSFPGPQITLEDVFAEGDEVACRFTLRAAHEGEFNGVPPTGRRVELKGITILRFAAGHCVERWSQADFMGMLQQLGVVPTAE